MNRKGIKKIMLFLLAFMLVFPVYSFGKAEAVQAAALKAPKLSKVVRVNKSVKITWKKSKGASGYYVMRKTENSSWKKIKTVKGGSKTSYTDKKVKSGTTYYYSIHLVIIVYSYLLFCYTPFKKQFWRIRNATLSCYTY